MRRIKELLLFVVPLLAICSLFLLTSCRDETEFQKAEHTYSQLGFSVSYNFPKGYNAVSSDDDANICICADGIEDKLDWSVILDVSDMNYTQFEEYKGNASKTAKDIKQKDGIWTFLYETTYERTIILKWFECGKILVLHKANDFNYNDALEIARTFEIDVWGEDIR